MADVTSVVSGTGKAVGRYFSIVSVLPSMLLVIYVFLLASSGSWQHSPNWHNAFAAVRNLGLVGAALLVVVGIAFALVLHPLQFSMVQLLEGYWGVGQLAQQIRVSRIRRHLRRRLWLNELGAGAASSLRGRKPVELDWVDWRMLRMEWVSQRDEVDRSERSYPEDFDHIMPTRLGNVLRRYEILAGAPYGLDAPAVLPCLALVAQPGHLDYLNDQRSGLDLAVRTSMTSAIACIVSLVFLWHSGLWLLIALVPYGIAYAAYRGSVIAAHSYGIAMTAVIALNRFTLYEYMRMPRPSSTALERKTNDTLTDLLRDYSADASLKYRYRGYSQDK
jgi:hypothetical protein